MILIGQYDSPFVRRVAIALALYGLAFEHQPLSAFGDAERLGGFNPLRRVPTLITGDGVALTDSYLILDYLDDMADPDRALLPRTGNHRRDLLRICGLACGVADKAVALFYEIRLHDVTSPLWVERCTTQIRDALALLEVERTHLPTHFWGGERLSHADIAVASMLRFLPEAHPGLVDRASIPALVAHGRECEGMDVFQTFSQPFAPPA